MTSPSQLRPQRADARRNREKVLEAARGAFGEIGLDAQMEDIARRASVGMGTVYRHFPTKDALVAALADAHFSRLADALETAERAGGSPWERLTAVLWENARTTAADVALCQMISRDPLAVHAAAAASKARLDDATARLLSAARAEGRMREDARVEDVRTIMCGFGHVAAQQQAGAPLDWERYLTIALDGLRAR